MLLLKAERRLHQKLLVLEVYQLTAIPEGVFHCTAISRGRADRQERAYDSEEECLQWIARRLNPWSLLQLRERGQEAI